VGSRGFAAWLAACICLLVPVAASATAPSTGARLARALRAPQIVSGKSAAVALDLATGETLFAQNADVSLEPASNEKLPVTYGALVELGPSYRFHTDVLGEGRRAGSAWNGRLVLKGYGDPTLQTDDLQRLAKKLYDLGIRTVTGHVVGDDSWFDDRWTAPGWRADFYGIESAPLSALVVNRGWRHRKLVRDPALAAAALFDQMLRKQGIEARDARVGAPAGAHAQTLATVHSQTLARLLRLMDAHSDNTTAEMVLKAIGAEAAGKGSTAAGAAVVSRDLAKAGVPLEGARIVDGSGLSRLDRVTARELSSLLALFWRTPSFRPLVQHSLAVAGETGTLEHRLLGPRTRGKVLGKTGTTTFASALSGYVGSRYAFVLVQNGFPVDWTAAHALQDRFVRTLAARALSG
jgi:D-alanyl-D-alanine carboxypeptidase/D-alanyl-D-alanine-endopeptidase (penicillin-binding protein 4)